jgi:Quinohemoprotein amine dehydrogenase, alpha subunit domain III
MRHGTRRSRARSVIVLSTLSLLCALVVPTVGSAGAATAAIKVREVFPPVVAVGSQPHVTVAGSGYADGMTVSVSGLNIDVVSLVIYNEDVFTVVLRVHHNAPLTARTLILQNPNGETHRCHDCITVVAQPTSTDAFPTHLGQGAKATLMGVHGTGFEKYVSSHIGNGVTVHFTQSAQPSAVVMAVTVGLDAPPGTRDIEIRNYSYGRTVCRACLTIDPGPKLAAIDPPSVAAGTQHAELTVTGTGFQDGMIVAIRGTHTESVQVVSDTEAIVTISVSASERRRPEHVILENLDRGRSKIPFAFTIT